MLLPGRSCTWPRCALGTHSDRRPLRARSAALHLPERAGGRAGPVRPGRAALRGLGGRAIRGPAAAAEPGGDSGGHVRRLPHAQPGAPRAAGRGTGPELLARSLMLCLHGQEACQKLGQANVMGSRAFTMSRATRAYQLRPCSAASRFRYLCKAQRGPASATRQGAACACAAARPGGAAARCLANYAQPCLTTCAPPCLTTCVQP